MPDWWLSCIVADSIGWLPSQCIVSVVGRPVEQVDIGIALRQQDVDPMVEPTFGHSVPLVVQSAQLVVAACWRLLVGNLVDSVLGDRVLTCKIVAQVQQKIATLVLA